MSGEDEMIHTLPWPLIKRLLSLAADRLEAQGWKPIESAPKDGTRVLVTRWPRTGHTDPTKIAWCYADSPAFKEWRIRLNKGLRYDPTHWRPLPAPPSEEA